MEVLAVTVVVTFWPHMLLLCVSVEAD